VTDESIVGDATRVAVQYANLARVVKIGDRILLDEGLITLQARAAAAAAPPHRTQ
jgi:pyruvate kinase